MIVKVCVTSLDMDASITNTNFTFFSKVKINVGVLTSLYMIDNK